MIFKRTPLHVIKKWHHEHKKQETSRIGMEDIMNNMVWVISNIHNYPGCNMIDHTLNRGQVIFPSTCSPVPHKNW